MDPEIKKLLENNQASILRLEKMVKKIQSKLMWNTIGNIIKIVIIVGPLIWAALYFSPMLKSYAETFTPMFQIFSMKPGTLQNLNTSQDNNVNEFEIDLFCNPTSRQAIIDQICK